MKSLIAKSGKVQKVAVMHALAPPDGTTRYIDHMSAISDGRYSIRSFQWSTALFGSYQIMHVHWPENFVRGSSAIRRNGKRVLTLLLLAKLSLRRIPIVRTLHNDKPHENLPRVDSIILRWVDQKTNAFIALNEATTVPVNRTFRVIPHGNYTATYPTAENVECVARRMLFFGLIRPYKQVPTLVSEFAALPASLDAHLRIVGKPQTPSIEKDVHDLVQRTKNTSARLEFVPDADLAVEIAEAQLVVLPYAEMNNSGAALLALSLGRPIVAPRTSSNEYLAAEVGSDWMYLYDGPHITAKILAEALTRTDCAPTTPPDLSKRDWTFVGVAHREVYEGVLAKSVGHTVSVTS